MKRIDNEGLSRYTFEDLLRISDLLGKKERDLDKQQIQVRFQIKYVNEILGMNNKRDETFAVLLPKRFFEIKFENESKIESTKKFNWKKVALKFIVEYKGLVTTDMVYERARIMYPSELSNRQAAIRNFSSALYYLTFKDGKLIRFKSKGSREYIYGEPFHFDEGGKLPKAEYLSKFERDRNNLK
jgi:hypothetical protein